MAASETGKEKPDTFECPNPNKDPYTLWGLVSKLQSDKSFAEGFAITLKYALGGDKASSDCIDSYLAPTTDELAGLGISGLKAPSMQRCTDSGLLVAVIANQSSSKKGR
jgi:hypothetical protein